LKSTVKIDTLESISPIDGRYREKISDCADYFSEYALIRRRLKVELHYLQTLGHALPELCEKLPDDWVERLDNVIQGFTLEEAVRVKDLESRLGHDVYAVIEYLNLKLMEIGLEILQPYVHIGLTSEDVNNIAYSSLIREFVRDIYLRDLLELISRLIELGRGYKSVAMLARTHGQPAVPTTFGKFIANYAYRLGRLAEILSGAQWHGKIGGSVGDLGSLQLAYPDIDWQDIETKVLGTMSLKRFPANTQVLPGEVFAAPIHLIVKISAVLSNMCRDLWLLGMLGILKFGKGGEKIHSSTMPQKKNPLHLENAEGVLDLSAELLSYISKRMIASRLHRDLSDSVLRRFYGVGLSSALLGMRSVRTALTRVIVDVEAMAEEVARHPETDSERLQVLLRRHGVKEGYELAMEASEKGLKWLSEKLEDLGLDAETRQKILKFSLDEYLQAAIRQAEELLDQAEAFLEKARGRLNG